MSRGVREVGSVLETMANDDDATAAVAEDELVVVEGGGGGDRAPATNDVDEPVVVVAPLAIAALAIS